LALELLRRSNHDVLPIVHTTNKNLPCEKTYCVIFEWLK
jgi:hypothetical protein